MNNINTTKSYIFDIRTTSLSSSCFEFSNSNGLEKIASAGLGWSYIRLPANIKSKMKQIRDMIDPSDLGEDGKESNPHITVKYGLTITDPEEVKTAVAKNHGGKVRMGKTSVFKNEDADVLKITVTSKSLNKLWDSLSTLDNEDRFDKYVAHSTLAYLKPGTGDKYVGIDLIDGEEFEFDSFVFQDAQDVKTEIKLGKLPINKTAQSDSNDSFDFDFDFNNLDNSTDFSNLEKSSIGFKNEDLEIGSTYRISRLDKDVESQGILEGIDKNGDLHFITIDWQSKFVVQRYSILKLSIVPKIRYKPNWDLMIGNIELVPGNAYKLEYVQNEHNSSLPSIATFQKKDVMFNGFWFYYPVSAVQDWSFLVPKDDIANISRYFDEIPIVNPNLDDSASADANSNNFRETLSNDSDNLYMIEMLWGDSEWGYIGDLDDDEADSMVFDNEAEAITEMHELIREFDMPEEKLRSVPCEFAIKFRDSPNISWANSDVLGNYRFDTVQNANEYLRTLDRSSHNYKIVPIRKENTQLSSSRQTIKIAQSFETQKPIMLDNQVFDNHDREHDVELSFKPKNSKDNPYSNPLITIYNTQGSSGKWSWTLDSLKTGHSDTLYLDAGAGWYVSGMKAVLTEAIEIIFALELRNQPNEIEAPVEEQIDKPKREYTPEELSLDFSDFDDLSFAEYLKHSSISSTKKTAKTSGKQDHNKNNQLYILEVFDYEESGWLEYHNDEDEPGEYNYYDSEEEAEIERQILIANEGIPPNNIRVSPQN